MASTRRSHRVGCEERSRSLLMPRRTGLVQIFLYNSTYAFHVLRVLIPMFRDTRACHRRVLPARTVVPPCRIHRYFRYTINLLRWALRYRRMRYDTTQLRCILTNGFRWTKPQGWHPHMCQPKNDLKKQLVVRSKHGTNQATHVQYCTHCFVQ